MAEEWSPLTPEEEAEREMLMNMISKGQEEIPLTPEEEKKKKERITYLEMKKKAIENPLSDVPFFPFGPGCGVMPDFGQKFECKYDILQKRPLTEEEERRFTYGMKVNLPSFPPLPWDKRQTVPLTPDLVLQFEQQRQQCTSITSTSSTVMSREEKRQQLAAQGRCLDGSYLTPYCKCDKQSCGFQPPYPPEFAPVWLAYKRQIRQSHCFDIDDHPPSPFGAAVGPLAPHHDFNGKAELLMELDNRAIQEYNEKECNVTKYKVLKIEKVNHSVTSYYQYWMTVKVLNLTLGTSTETFQIHAGKSILNDDDKVIYCCRPKEEAIVGLPSCDVCFGLLPREEALEL
ncbi:uncharacterized protein LOC132615324 [Lycium barbarum]|uniref:uncharacterized protein LOC132615324 n=1 Tax=Lycium barbarum TaxID=112863 RepID=UPI00293E85B6|nr:uncharacterized protein LOC132615324 [Lycium barbarum]